MQYSVYIIENAKGRHYVGVARDPEKRLREHNSGSAKSTRPFGPWQLIYTEKHESRSQACKREWYLKHAEGRQEKLNIIDKYGGIA